MNALNIVETVLLVVAFVYIVALLRSHADILRRLSVLEEGGVPASPSPGRSWSSAARNAEAEAAPAAITGTSPEGDALTLATGPGSPPTLLAFLSGGCTSCGPFWDGLRERRLPGELAQRVVIVTHGVERESPARVRSLAPGGVDVVMASGAWEDFEVPASPHFVLTDGSGGVRGRGSALSWEQLTAMVQEAGAEETFVSGSGSGSTAQRAARAEQALAGAGIGPGHPSLYPAAPADAAGGPAPADPDRREWA